jgi:hypothetical protein
LRNDRQLVFRCRIFAHSKPIAFAMDQELYLICAL